MSSVAINIFGLQIYWYGIILACAVFCGVMVAECIAKYREIPKNFFIDNSPLMILVGFIGARLYYCLVNFDYYIKKPLEIIFVRQGGLSIHGMILVGIMSIYLISKVKKLKFLQVLDVLACSVPLAQGIGRWGNFFNREAFGIPTNQNWGLYIPLANRPDKYANFNYFHPTFLYESILDIIIFLILLKLIKSNDKDGIVFFMYLILYALVRFFIEALRVDSALNLFTFPVAQIASVILFIVGLIGVYKIKFCK